METPRETRRGRKVKPKNPADPNAQHINQLFGRHEGANIIVVGSGSSMMGFDYSRLNPFVTIALNDSVKAPGFVPRYHLFSDGHLYEGHAKRNPSGGYQKWLYSPLTKVICPKNQRQCFVNDRGADWGQAYQFDPTGSPNAIKPGDDGLFVNRTVATGAIMLAWKLGASRIWLMGIDGYKMNVPDDTGGRKDLYYFDGTSKPPEKRKTVHKKAHGGDAVMVVQDRHDFWRKQMEELKAYFKKHQKAYPGPFPGAGIYNLSALSTIEAWQKVESHLALSYIEATTL